MKNGWRVRTEPATGAALDLARRLLYGCLSRYDTGEAGGEIVCRVAADAAPGDQGYRIETADRRVCITGGTPAAVLYGVSDFVNVWLPELEQAHVWMKPYYFVNPFAQGFPERRVCSRPDVLRRGLWTWGHVIYDYRGYLENMAHLKLNEVVIWNDFAPLNAADIVAYAHELGIRVIWGYSWGWDTQIGVDISDPAALAALEEQAVERFVREYSALPGDGIYFQSFTETAEDTVNGCLIAKVVVGWVNRVCARILAIAPGLELQFGLHATSVHGHMDYIAQVDPRVRIVWEDCGAFPYAYMPDNLADASGTQAFTQQMLQVRPQSLTGVVTKGMICLDWTSFVHRAGPERIGEADSRVIEARLPLAGRVMRLVQSEWMIHGDALVQTVRRLHEGDPGCQILALLEDGLFERCIWLPAALFAGALWDTGMPFDTLLARTARRPDVCFAQ